MFVDRKSVSPNKRGANPAAPSYVIGGKVRRMVDEMNHNGEYKSSKRAPPPSAADQLYDRILSNNNNLAAAAAAGAFAARSRSSSPSPSDRFSLLPQSSDQVPHYGGNAGAGMFGYGGGNAGAGMFGYGGEKAVAAGGMFGYDGGEKNAGADIYGHRGEKNAGADIYGHRGEEAAAGMFGKGPIDNVADFKKIPADRRNYRVPKKVSFAHFGDYVLPDESDDEASVAVPGIEDLANAMKKVSIGKSHLIPDVPRTPPRDSQRDEKLLWAPKINRRPVKRLNLVKPPPLFDDDE